MFILDIIFLVLHILNEDDNVNINSREAMATIDFSRVVKYIVHGLRHENLQNFFNESECSSADLMKFKPISYPLKFDMRSKHSFQAILSCSETLCSMFFDHSCDSMKNYFILDVIDMPSNPYFQGLLSCDFVSASQVTTFHVLYYHHGCSKSIYLLVNTLLHCSCYSKSANRKL